MSKILIVEDEDPIRRILRSKLEKLGYEVWEAEDGKIGSKIYTEEHIDVVITDIFMPEKDGLELIREIKHDSRDVKLIAISGGGNIEGCIVSDYLEIAKKFGVDYTFEKPFELHEILDAVKDLIG